MEACGESVPVGTVECGGGELGCRKVGGHEGRHEKAVSRCNRPEGHGGKHMVLTENAVRLVVWGEGEG
jgi:hypothetical protein